MGWGWGLSHEGGGKRPLRMAPHRPRHDGSLVRCFHGGPRSFLRRRLRTRTRSQTHPLAHKGTRRRDGGVAGRLGAAGGWVWRRRGRRWRFHPSLLPFFFVRLRRFFFFRGAEAENHRAATPHVRCEGHHSIGSLRFGTLSFPFSEVWERGVDDGACGHPRDPPPPSLDAVPRHHGGEAATGRRGHRSTVGRYLAGGTCDHLRLSLDYKGEAIVWCPRF